MANNINSYIDIALILLILNRSIVKLNFTISKYIKFIKKVIKIILLALTQHFYIFYIVHCCKTKRNKNDKK